MDDVQLKDMLRLINVVAMVGLSSQSDQPSYKIAQYLKNRGLRIIPINPKCVSVLNEKCYADLSSAQTDIQPQQIDLVVIICDDGVSVDFVDEIIKIGVKTLWLQNKSWDDLVQKGTAMGLNVVTNRCIMSEYQRLLP